MTNKKPPVPTPEMAKPSVISPIWLLPVLAVFLGLYLMYQSIAQAGIEIRIHFTNATGIVAGKTLVKYQGLTIGKIKNIVLDDELKGVFVTADIDNKAEKILRRDSQFWLVTPRASITGISGLDALVSGNYIDVYPGSGPFSVDFKAVNMPPSNLPDEGLVVRLKTEKLSSIRPDSEIFYKKIPVGKVHNYTLDKSGEHLIIEAVINPRYSYLVKQNSRFWNVSGMNAEFNFDGVKFTTESLSAIISGALAFDSPKDGEPAIKNHEFTLYDDASDAERAIEINFKLSHNSEINIGNAIYHNGVKVGKITALTSQPDSIAVAHVDPSIAEFLREETQFWIEKPKLSLTGSKNLRSLVTGNFIRLKPGRGKTTTTFSLASSAQELIPSQTILLSANNGKGLQPNSKIYFKNYPIGHVAEVNFNQETKMIDLTVKIYNDFQDLIKRNSRFVNLSSININAGIAGINVSAGPLPSLIEGGIALINDSQFADKSPKSHYQLYPSLALAKLGQDAFQNSRKVTLVSDLSSVVSIGAPVYYHKLPVGKVGSFKLTQDNQKIKITLEIEGQYAHLVGPSSVFWNVSGIDISGGISNFKVKTESLLAIAAGGINFDNITADPATNPQQLAKTETRSNKPLNYILYNNLEEATDNRPDITLIFPSGNNVAVGTAIKHKGIKVGEITQLELNVDDAYVSATAKLNSDYARYFMRQGSLYWLEKPEVSLKGVKNIDAIVSGAYINVTKGTGPEKHRFSARMSAPMIAAEDVGLSITLTSSRLMALEIGSPVFYRQLKVGSITSNRLSKQGDQVLITVNIKPDYQHLVRKNSQFWAISGFNVDVGLSGATVKAESLKTILIGGISFATPPTEKLYPVVKPFALFPLAQESKEEWLTWNTQIPKPN